MRAIVASALLRGLRRISAKKRVRGLEVVLAFEPEDQEILVNKIHAALAVIEAGDARRYQRIRRDLRAVLVTKAGGPEFVPPLAACLLGYNVIKDATPLGLAFMLVHEAAHARLWRLGFVYDSPLRDRIERACIVEELRFAQAMNASPDVVAWVHEKISHAPRWSSEGIEVRRTKELDEFGMPRWMQNLLRPGRRRI